MGGPEVERETFPLSVAWMDNQEKHMRYAVVDTETTGLVPSRSAILEIAILIFEDGERVGRFYTKIRPTDEELAMAQRKALEINGYLARPEDWDGAPDFEAVAPDIADALDGAVAVGHNVSFDVEMIRANFKRHGYRGRVPWAKIDTITLVREHLFPAGLDRSSLDSVRRFLGWSSIGAHTAAKDAEDTAALFHLLWRSTWWTRTRIRMARWFGLRVKP